MASAEPADTGDVAEPSPDDAANSDQQSFLGQFTQADRRAFVLGIAGGVIVNIITAFILAVAYLLSKSFDEPGSGINQSVGVLLLLAIITAWVCILIPFFSRRERYKGRVDRTVRWIFVGAGAVAIAISLLTLLGNATGLVK